MVCKHSRISFDDRLTESRDQELRFTVHESPDYYKLKCSIFNDDKKTDLIGEAWIDLHEVIVPGGGQSDSWRQLNFKGKYAGDVRIELTYYDTRPKPEVSPEKRKQRDKASSTASDAQSAASGSRHLGPREIKRRPLPLGPGDHSSPASATQAPQWLPSEDPPDMWTGHGYTNAHPPPRPPKQKFVPETPDDVGYDLNPQFGPDSYEPPHQLSPSHDQRHPSHDIQHNYDEQIMPYEEPDQYRIATYQPRPLPVQPTQPHPPASRPAVESSSPRYLPYNPPTQPVFESSPPPHSPYSPPPQPAFESSPPPHSLYNTSPLPLYHPSPPAGNPPQVTPPMPVQHQPWQNRTSTSPTKHAVYRDSPLRQSVSPFDMPAPEDNYPDPRFDEDEPPPPPPIHGGQVSRSPMGTPSHQSPHTHPSPRTPVKHGSVEERGPLQRLEREYEPYQGSSPHSQQISRRLPSPQPYDMSPPRDHDRYPRFSTERRKSCNDNINPLQPTSSAGDFPYPNDLQDQNPIPQQFSESSRPDFRQSTGLGLPRRAQTFDNIELPDERNARRSDPIVVRPRAISPNPIHTIPRKSITPTPSTPVDRSHVGRVPFGPDSYEVLNPGTSPTIEDDPYATTEQAKEAARQKEVDKLRDQGPIIGNDGRVIDPSDHLPADTWAPEPERKNRKPEHVIKIRTREDARMQNRTGSLPISARPHSVATSLYQPSPPAAMSPSYQPSPPAAMSPSYQPSPPTAIPASSLAEESSGGRNRLRKTMPNRPLPTQPHPQAQTSPAVMTTSSNEDRPSPSGQRFSLHSSPAGGLPQRPPLSEYQVPAANNYSPRGGPGPPQRLEYPNTPTKISSQMPVKSMNYGESPYGSEDSLALELSTIDIGPSRMGRSALRPQRGYGAY